MAQRVQLAAAMVHDPQLLVLDEPFAGLDPTAVAFLTDVIRDHVQRGRHLVFSSHQLDLVEDLCESVVMLHRGGVVMRGSVRDLKRDSGERYLWVDAAVRPEWLDGVPASIARATPTESRLLLEAGASAAAVLDRVRDHVEIDDFGVGAPSLSELFLAATGTAVSTEGTIA
jgi:ABC-2 type transport system ATP-binding protein